MKKKLISIIPFLLTVILMACNNNPKDDQPEGNETGKYLGNYTSQDDACDIRISVEKRDRLYKYQITTATLKSSGNLKIDTVHNGVYFRFTNLSSESESYTIEAKVYDDEFRFQNYGNAMNQFHHIKDCDLKYITFTKEQTSERQ